jgi:tRNA G10  N-methylase Trm11
MAARRGITRHVVREGDARDLSFLDDNSIRLVCTSPPYGALKTYPEREAQLGNIELAELIRDPATSIAEKSKLEHEYSDTFVARSPFTEFDF